MSVRTRNATVDILRGIAMLMVVMGHTMTGCTTGSEETLLFNIIWSIQMPLFFLISGYVTKYSPAPSDWESLRKQLWKRTRGYLLPWFVWTFGVRGLLFGEQSYWNLRYLLWNMDSGYWFLISLWTITVIFTASEYFAAKCKRKLPLLGVCYGLGAVLLLCIGALAGMSFLAIKQTLYYMLFYGVGAMFAAAQERLVCAEKGKWLRRGVYCICALLYVILVGKFNLYEIADNLYGIAIRGTASICGCVCLVVMCSRIKLQMRLSGVLQWVGRSSLGIYLSHYLLLCLVKADPLPAMRSAEGVAMVVLNFTITILLSSLVAKVLDGNKFTARLFLGR